MFPNLKQSSWVKQLALERLEPYDGKLSRTVLRGAGAGNSPGLPGGRRVEIEVKVPGKKPTAL